MKPTDSGFDVEETHPSLEKELADAREGWFGCRVMLKDAEQKIRLLASESFKANAALRDVTEERDEARAKLAALTVYGDEELCKECWQVRLNSETLLVPKTWGELSTPQRDAFRASFMHAVASTLAKVRERVEAVPVEELAKVSLATHRTFPKWDELGDPRKETWCKEAEAIRARLLSSITQDEKPKEAPSPDPDGWIVHVPGLPMPCDGEMLVEVKLVSGVASDVPVKASKYYWRNIQGSSIAFWRPAQPAPEEFVPLGPGDFKPGCAIRHKTWASEGSFLMANVAPKTVCGWINSNLQEVSYKELAESWEISFDNGETWDDAKKPASKKP